MNKTPDTDRTLAYYLPIVHGIDVISSIPRLQSMVNPTTFQLLTLSHSPVFLCVPPSVEGGR